jgi:hypothetical protein
VEARPFLEKLDTALSASPSAATAAAPAASEPVAEHS